MSKETPENKDNVLSKEELLRITEDPYFQYLIEKKARAQTKTYLALIGSVILAILAYSGWTFKSATEQIEREKSAIQTTREKIQEIAADVEKQKGDTSKEADSVKNTVADASRFAQQSSIMTNAMLETAKANLENSQKSQGTLFDQQSRLLTTVSKINDAANQQLTQVGTRLNEVQTLASTTKQQVTETEQRVSEVLARAGSLDNVAGNLNTLTESATRLNLIQNRLLQGGIVGTVFMRARQPATIKMLDPVHPDEEKYDWLITFVRFKLTNEQLRVWGTARRINASEVIPFEVMDIDATPSKMERPFHSLKKHGIPFKLQLNFAYHTLYTRDFASLRIFGEEQPTDNAPVGLKSIKD